MHTRKISFENATGQKLAALLRLQPGKLQLHTYPALFILLGPGRPG